MDDAPRNPELLEALGRAAQSDNAGARHQVYDLLLKSRLLVPVNGPPASDGSVDMISIESGDGRAGLPVFTDQDALAAWNDVGHGTIALDGPVVFQMALQAGLDAVVLNPAGPAGGAIESPEVRALAEGRMPEAGLVPTSTVPKGAEVAIGPIETRPQEAVLRQIGETLAVRPEVQAGYLFMIKAGGQPPQLCIGLHVPKPLSDEGLDGLMADLMARLDPALQGLGDVQSSLLDGWMLDAAREVGIRLFER